MLLDAPCMSLSLTALVMLLHIPSLAFSRHLNELFKAALLFQVNFFHGIPNPEIRTFDAAPYLEKIKAWSCRSLSIPWGIPWLPTTRIHMVRLAEPGRDRCISATRGSIGFKRRLDRIFLICVAFVGLTILTWIAL